MRIPKHILLPNNFKIVVLELPEDQVIGITGDPDTKAAWISAKNTILLSKERPAALKKWDFIHETCHAFIDWLEHVGALGEPSDTQLSDIKEETKNRIVDLLEDRKAEICVDKTDLTYQLLTDLIDEIKQL